MDIALKQRLVGAVVLVALGVIFIPMLLDGSADQTQRWRKISIPEPADAGMETRLLPLNPQQTSSTTEQVDTTPVPQATIQSSEPVEQIVVTNVPTSTGPVNQVTPLEPESSPQTSDQPAPNSVPPTQTRPAEPGPAWAIQLGSFSNASNADSLVKSVNELGYPAYSERVNVGSKSLHRVRVGPFGQETEALQAGTTINAEFSDLDISVRRLDVQSSSSPVADLTGWMVQVGVFSKKDNAETLQRQLQQSGFAAHLVTLPGDTQVFRVRVGPAIDRDEAASTRDQLKTQFNLNGLIVSHP